MCNPDIDSKYLQELLCEMITYDYEKRITAIQIMKNVIFTSKN